MSEPPNFDRLAGLYRWMELCSFGPWLAKSRLAFLDELTDCRRALVVGDGDGRFTARMLHACPAIHVDAVDASAAMLGALRRRAEPHAGRVHSFCGDARVLAPPGLENICYDLIVTHFFLDCLTTREVEELAGRVRRCASPGARWVVSEFAIPGGWFGRLVAGPVVSGLYWAFGWLTGLTVRTLPDHRTALRAAGFILSKQRRWLGGMLVSELWSHDAEKAI